RGAGCPAPVGRGKPGPTVVVGPSLAAEGGSFFVGPASSRPAEPGLGAVCCPTPVGRGKPGPTVEVGPSLAAEGGSFFVGPGSSRPAEPGLGAVWCPTLVGQGKPGPTVEVDPSLAAEGGRFSVGPGSSRPAEPGLGAERCPPAPAGVNPALQSRPALRSLPRVAAFLWGRVHPGQRSQAWARCGAPPSSARVNPAPHRCTHPECAT